MQSDDQKFIAFVQAYFEYLEIHGNPRAEAVRLGSYPDIDQTLDDFVQYFQSSYLNEFPENIESGADTKLAVKNSNAYYSEKGNARSTSIVEVATYHILRPEHKLNERLPNINKQ